MDLAAKIGCPVIGINDSGGARIQEGVVSLGAYGDVFVRNVTLLGRDPADLADHGPVRRRRRLLPGDHRLHLHGEGDLAHVHHRPRRDQDGHRRGGRVRGARRRDEPTTPSRASRTSPPTTRTRASRTRATCSRSCPRTTSRRRRACCRPTTRCAMDAELDHVVPDNPNKPYDMRDVIRYVVDDGEFFEVHEHYAQNIVCGFARLNGYAVGVVGNQPAPARRRARHRLLARRPRASCAPATRSTSRSSPSRRPRLPARHRAGVGRDHPPRRQAAVRLHRGDGPEDHRHHAQGLRRRLRRHGLQAPARRLQLRLADRRGRGDGPRGRGQHHLPPRHRALADARRRAARS